MYIRQRDVVIGAVIVLYIVFFALSPPAMVRSVLSHPVGVAGAFGAAIYTTLYYSKPIGALLIIALLASLTRVGREDFTVYTGTFNEASYLAANPDVKAAVDKKQFASGKAHWDAGGKREGRKGSGLTAVQLVDGKSYKCSGSSEFGMVQGGQLRGYGSPAIAASYDPAWSSAQVIDCTGAPRGASLTTPKASRTPAARLPPPPPPITTPTAPTPTTPPPVTPPKPTPAPPPAPAPKPVMACNIENFASF